MKRFVFAVALCTTLLAALSAYLLTEAHANEDAVAVLLKLPAPPPPNPFLPQTGRRDAAFYDPKNPPRDDAPIEDLIEYWSNAANNYRGATTSYMPSPSERTLGRLLDEMRRRPELATPLLNALPDNGAAADVVKAIYDRSREPGGLDREQRKALRNWLRMNSGYFSEELERVSAAIRDEGGYVSNSSEDNLLALTRHDFDRAQPIIDRLYSDSTQPVSKVLALWALYRHALETDSSGDVERYRSELMRTVEDRSLSDGVRDKAFDALMLERDFPGREDWTFTLFEDETLVNMQRFTMLTTVVTYAPPDKYVPKLLDLIERTQNKTVRLAAVRNILIVLERNPGAEIELRIIRALLPWLEDPNWLRSDRWADNEYSSPRGTLIRKLGEHVLPESVPGLIRVLDEKAKRPGQVYIGNVAVNTNVKPSNTAAGDDIYFYPFRYSAVSALAKQRDPRAVPALRRILPEGERWESSQVVGALYQCGGFSVGEQLEALDLAAQGVRASMQAETNGVTVQATMPDAYATRKPLTPDEIKMFLSQHLLAANEVSDQLANAVVLRIESLDKTDKQTAAAYRRMILKWQNSAINLLYLSDLRRGSASGETLLRLLAQRRELRERQAPDVFALKGGTPSAIGIAACLLEDAGDYAAILDGGDAESKIAMLACGRLIRAPLPVDKVAANLERGPAALTVAAELYLESEDSPEARRIVLSRHPGEAKILGATAAFKVEGTAETYDENLAAIYRSVGNETLYYGWIGSSNDEELEKTEKELRAEVKKDETLLGIYSYDDNFVRIYNDRVIFSWNEDEARYRERPLTKFEFDDLKAYLIAQRADELPPFLACGGAYCEASELVMVGRNGGRRVYTNGQSDFFRGLDKYFADLKQTPATLRYALSRDIPGLEIVLAADNLHIETVWKNGPDLRVCASDAVVRKKVKEEVYGKPPEDDDGDTDEEPAPPPADADEKAEKRRYEGFAWYGVSGGEATPAAQPPGVEYIPLRDQLSVQPENEAWKARSAGIEIRTSTDGVFKLVRGRLVRVAKGSYQWPVITPDGRWLLVTKQSESDEGQVVRIDLTTNREYPVDVDGYGQKYPVAFARTLGKVVVVRDQTYYDESVYEEENDRTASDDDPENILLVDAVNGLIFPGKGELRPLSQQTFRPLQKASQPDEYWAAMPDWLENRTRLGIYNAKWLTFKEIRTIPKIKFNSMDMWVDEAENRVYFVYRGHLLALPLK